MGRLADRFGIAVPVGVGAAMLALGCVIASQAMQMWQLTLAQRC